MITPVAIELLARTRTLVLSLAFFLTAVSGCLDAEPPKGSGAGWEDAWAEYESSAWGATRMSFGGEQMIRTSNGETVPAWPLRISTERYPRSDMIQWFDGNLRPVVFRTSCWEWKDEACDRELVFWWREQFVAAVPLDIGLDLVLGRPLERWHQGVPVSLQPQIDHAAGLITLTFADDSFVGIDHVPFTGSMVFETGNVFPRRVDLTVDEEPPIDLRLTDAAPNWVSDAAGNLPADGPYSLAPRAEAGVRFFAGERDDTFGLGYTHIELLDSLFHEVPEAARLVARQGCLVEYQLNPEVQEDRLLELLQSRELAHVIVRVMDGEGNEMYVAADVKQRNDRLEWEFQDTNDPPALEWRCSDATSRPPSVSLSDFVEHQQELLQHYERQTGLAYEMGPPPGGVGVSAVSWHKFWMFYEPKGVPTNNGVKTYVPHHLLMDADLNRFVQAVVHPSDATSLMGSR